MNPTEHVLEVVNSTVGIIGLQEAVDTLFAQVDKLVDEGEVLHRRITTMHARVNKMRNELDTSRIKTGNCSQTRDMCRARTCGCTYADMRDLLVLEAKLTSLNQEFDHVARVLHDLNIVHGKILWPKMQQHLKDREYLAFLAEMLELCGELTASQRALMTLPGFFRFDGTPLGIKLHIGRDPVETIILKSTHRYEGR